MNSFGIDNVITEKANVELTDIEGGVKVTFSGDIDVQFVTQEHLAAVVLLWHVQVHELTKWSVRIHKT